MPIWEVVIKDQKYKYFISQSMSMETSRSRPPWRNMKTNTSFPKLFSFNSIFLISRPRISSRSAYLSMITSYLWPLDFTNSNQFTAMIEINTFSKTVWGKKKGWFRKDFNAITNCNPCIIVIRCQKIHAWTQILRHSQETSSEQL